MPLVFLVAALALLQPPPDPLAPLSSAELRQTLSILRREGVATESARFPWIALKEPEKAAVLEGRALPREAEVTLYDPRDGRTSTLVVDLKARRIASRKEHPGAQARMLPEEFQAAWEIVREDQRWRAALQKRGMDDPAQVSVNVWGAGRYSDAPETGRLARVVAYRASGQSDFSRPIEGLFAIIDLEKRKVLRVTDTGAVPIPAREPPLPIPATPRIEPPATLPFTQQNGEIAWKRWKLRFDLHPREGLVLRRVRFDDRSVLWRASLSEMVVPYGDPSPTWRWRNAFDAGEYGMGVNAAPLTRGIDVPESAALFDATLADERGNPTRIVGAMALHERDGGLLYKHEKAARRGRQLVLTSLATLGNYDYGFSWIFSEDGTLECETLLTGILLAKAAPAHQSGADPSGHALGKGLVAVNHQHFFCWRLDLDVDGQQNRLVECNTAPLPPDAQNPEGNAIVMRETVLKTESEAKRRLDMAQSRFWKALSPMGTGYALLPGENAVPLAAPSSVVRQRAGFLDAHLWATPLAEDERWAAGEFPNQSKGGEGLPAWTKADRTLAGQDIVLWHTVGVTHLPRPEEWPVMNLHRAHFKLVPVGFFPRNPSLE